MHLDGRSEKRVGLRLPVRLMSRRELRPPDKVFTRNVSPHGLCVVTDQRWQPAELFVITLPSNGFLVPAQVVYCQPLGEGLFCVGMKIPGRPVNWQIGPSDRTPVP